MLNVLLLLYRYKTGTEIFYYLIIKYPIYAEKQVNFRVAIALK